MRIISETEPVVTVRKHKDAVTFAYVETRLDDATVEERVDYLRKHHQIPAEARVTIYENKEGHFYEIEWYWVETEFLN